MKLVDKKRIIREFVAACKKQGVFAKVVELMRRMRDVEMEEDKQFFLEKAAAGKGRPSYIIKYGKAGESKEICVAYPLKTTPREERMHRTGSRVLLEYPNGERRYVSCFLFEGVPCVRDGRRGGIRIRPGQESGGNTVWIMDEA